MAAAAVPAIISGGGWIASKVAGNAAKKSAMRQTPAEQGYYRGTEGAAGTQTQLADTFRKQGSDLFSTGAPAVKQATDYYSTLLGGNRAAMTQAVAPEAGAIGDVYKGADRSLEASGARGAVRDQAAGELNRERAGRIAGLLGSVRPNAAAQLAGTGLSTVGAATSSLAGAAGSAQGAGSIYAGLVGDQQRQRQMGEEAGNAASGQIGALVADLLKNNASKSGKKAAA